MEIRRRLETFFSTFTENFGEFMKSNYYLTNEFLRLRQRQRSLLSNAFVVVLLLLFPVLMKSLILYAFQSWSVLFCPVLSCSVLFCPVQSCSVLFSPVQSCSVLFSPVQYFFCPRSLLRTVFPVLLTNVSTKL